MAILRALRVWQILLLVAVPIIAAGITYGTYTATTGNGGDGLAGDQQLIPVQRGDLVNEVSVNGSLAYSERETLTFGGKGTVGQILVEEGQTVTVGDSLATLDAASVASLEKAVAQAEVKLQDAREALAATMDPRTPLELAQAELKVANAELALKDARDDLDALRQPSASAVAKAEAAVATAQLSLQQAEDSLAALMAPTSQAVANAEAKVIDARVAADDAQALLDTLEASPTPEDIADAQAGIDSAEAALVTAEADLKLVQIEWDNRIEDSQDDLDTAVTGYRTAMTKWLGMDLEDEDLYADLEDLLAKYAIDLETIFDPTLRFQDSSRSYWSVGPPSNDPATAWNETTVYIWLNLWPGTILATCDNGVVPAQAACVKKEIEDASNVYGAARDALETTLTLSAKTTTVAEGAVTRAINSLAAAEDNWAEVEAGPDPLDIEAQESRLALATANLKSAQDDLLELTGAPNAIEVDAKSKQVAVARADLDDAKEVLASLLSGPDAADVAAKERQVAVARASLDEATADLADLTASADPLEVALREAEVASAGSELETALERLSGATLTAPIAGIIWTIIAEAGQQVNVNTPILEIVDPTVVEVDGSVDEIDVLFIRTGASASITMDALLGQTLTGTVSEIATAATSQQGVVTYPLTIRVEVPPGTQLPEGLSAVASVVIREDRDVLLVPIDALRGTFQEPTLRVMIGGEIVERPVVLGNSDDFWIVVSAGVAENELIVMEVQGVTTQGFGGFGAGRFGGGIGGFTAGGFGRGGQAGRR